MLTRTTLEQVLPSKLTTLSVYELHYQLEKVTVHEAMVRQVVTVTEDVPIEQAARTMWEKKIGCLPVIRGNKLVGIVTDNDLMRTMFEGTSERDSPAFAGRSTLRIPGDPGPTRKTDVGGIAAERGDITALGRGAF